MRVLTAVIEIATLPVLDARQQLALRCAIALEFVRDDHAWHIHQALEELAEELLCCLLVAPLLYEDIEDVIVLIHGAPQVMTLAMDGQKYLV
jgi:hypothetical protein